MEGSVDGCCSVDVWVGGWEEVLFFRHASFHSCSFARMFAGVLEVVFRVLINYKVEIPELQGQLHIMTL
jgi:hypothetical protein